MLYGSYQPITDINNIKEIIPEVNRYSLMYTKTIQYNNGNNNRANMQAIETQNCMGFKTL